MYFICRSAGETRPRMNLACLFSAATTASASLRAERRDEGGRDLEVGRHAHFGNRNHRRLDQRIEDLAALQHFGQRMTHLLADAQLALGGAGLVERDMVLILKSRGGMGPHAAA